MKRHNACLAAALLVLPLVAGAHTSSTHSGKKEAVRKEQKAWGIAGDAKAVVRTIEVSMSDNMRFTPALIEVREGETLRLVHRNRGKQLHEFVLGTRAELESHAAMMLKFPNMAHEEPYMAHVAAGRRSEMIWTFNRVGEFEFACLIPGHYQAGMLGKIKVVPK